MKLAPAAMVSRKPMWLRLTIAMLFGTLVALLPTTPAAAHVESGPAATNYLTKLDGIAPHSPGLTARVVRGGSRLELTNNSGESVIIVGYSKEPYLRLADGKIYANAFSQSAYINEDLNKNDNTVQNNDAPPKWKQIGTGSTVRWHDHRTHWMSKKPPSIVSAEPGSKHRLSNWSVPLRVDGASANITGTLDYLPPPRAAVWWAGVLVLAALVAIVGLTPFGVVSMSIVLAGAALAELVDSVARVLDSAGRDATVWTVLAELGTEETYGTLTALAALAGVAVGLRRGPAAPFALALAASCLGILGAFTDIAVFSHGRATGVFSGETARALTLLTLAGCAGVAIAGWLRVRREGRTNKEVPSDDEPVMRRLRAIQS